MKIMQSVFFSLALTGICAQMSVAEADRGRDGEVKILYWQAPSILNPYISGGTKDIEASSMIIEPLARYDANGQIVPWLVETVPTLENGGISKDLKSITWKILDDLKWSDGTKFTSADVEFTYRYCTHPDSGCARSNKFSEVSSVETPDDQTVEIKFKIPMPNPYGVFVGAETPILQKAQFADCLGDRAAGCTTANFGPVGTGAFEVVKFQPNDLIILSANENYREKSKPAFSKVVFKGGGSAIDAGRAVLETGEFDYAWNLQLAPDVIGAMEEKGKGQIVAGFGPLVERLMLNHTNPDPALDRTERSIVKPHPFLNQPAVYKAMSLAIDRNILVDTGYGTAGKVTCNWLAAPEAFNSTTLSCDKQDIPAANRLLDDAGIIDTDGDGVREFNGEPLKLLFQTSENQVRRDFQSLIKQWWAEIGIETELRTINASVYFSSDPSSPDTTRKFYADVEMYANTFAGTDPQFYLANALCDEAPRPENNWQARNVTRFCMTEYDTLYQTYVDTVDRDARAEIAKELNDLFVQNGGIIPLVQRGRLSAHGNSLGGVELNVWDSELWNIADWYRR